MNTLKTQCLIIGSGPAGYTAAIYAARADLHPILVSGAMIGGQLTITTEVENYPGYPDGIQGPEMMDHFRKQAERLGTVMKYGTVMEINFVEGKHVALVDNEYNIEAYTVIISTGASAQWLGLESEQRLNGFGVSACAVCDGFFFKGKEVAIVGGGDTACEEASYLAKLCSKVYMLVRKGELKASKAMQHRVLNTPNIEMLFHHETLEIMGEKKVAGMRILNNITKEEKEIAIQGFFVAIGHIPNTQLFKGVINMDENGYLITEPGSTKTNVAGVFAAGDVQDHIYRQAITAAGTGCMAAMDAERYLATKTV